MKANNKTDNFIANGADNCSTECTIKKSKVWTVAQEINRY